MSKTNWHTKAVYVIVALAFVLGMALVPQPTQAAETPDGALDKVTIVPSPIAYDVKGACHEICLENVPKGATIEWWLEPGVELSPEDILDCEEPYYGDVFNPDNHKDDYCIVIRATREGDIHVKAKVCVTVEGAVAPVTECVILHTEKKWGELSKTELDVDPNKAGVQHTKEVAIPAGATGKEEETITDMVYAKFLKVPGDVPAGGAIVHWWLFEDTDETQKFIDELMDYLARHEGALDDDHWAAHGKYKVNDPDDPLLGGKQPWEYINDYALTHHADSAIFDWDAINPASPGAIWPPGWYAWNVSEDYHPGETAGRAQAVLTVDLDQLEPCVPEKIMIVVLVHYPGGTTEQEDYFNGENVICLEKGKKEFHKAKKPVITQVKTPQLRWAGEKIVLEKDWGLAPYYSEKYWVDEEARRWYSTIELGLYAAIYSLEEGSIGNLEPIDDAAGMCVKTPNVSGMWIDLEYLGLPTGAQQVICPLGGYYYNFSDDPWPPAWGGYEDSQCILSTQQSGEADVNAALYEVWMTIGVSGYIDHDYDSQAVQVTFNGPIANHGFLVYFLEFEDVTLAEDITPLDSLTNIEPDATADVAVQVRGFFDSKYSHLMATMREAKAIDLNNDGVADKWLPAGRYIMPDDWWLIAETEDVTLRPNYDLMDQANNDTIVSPVDSNYDHVEELGPYDSEVRTTDPPGLAEWPSIGPFSTYQTWSIEDMWVATATVPSSLGPNFVRNTVVPNGTIDEYDAPMPQALVIFDVVSDTGTLSGLDKGNLEGYGYIGTPPVYQSPFYAVEIPANWQIPAGYNWMSWTRDPLWMYWYYSVDGPYDYWTDLMLKSIIANTSESPIDRKDVEVYCDNHGIAGVTVGPLEKQGKVTITATAEFPYTPKRGKYGPRVSDEIDIFWGAAIEHLNPDFEAFPRSGNAPLKVRFENWTVGGTPPYVKAQWDFNCDGTIEKTLTGTEAEVMADVNWTYSFPGLYTICLTMTDSTLPEDGGPLVHTEKKLAYVNVLSAGILGDLNGDGKIDKSEAIAAVEAYFDGVLDKEQAIQIVMLYFES